VVSTSSIGGLVSGLDTTSIISQLMQLEAQPQNALKTKVKTEQSTIAAYQSVNTKMKALQTAAHDLTQTSNWQLAAATSSSDAVSATATSGAPAGQYTFDVTHLASAQISTATVPDTGAATGGSISIALGGGTPTDIAVTTNTPEGVASAINANATLGVRATVINSDQGKILQLVGTKSGAANGFTVTGLSGAVTNQTTAADALLTVGTVGSGGYTISSPSNTFSNFIPHVTMTAAKQQAGVTVNVSTDASAMADKIQALVTAANDALGEVNDQTAYKAADATKGTAATASPLLGDLTVQDLGTNILGAVANGNAGYGSFKQLGLQTQQDGTLVFDKDKFIAAYQANPSAVQTAVQTGLATTLDAVSKSATDIVNGTITTAIQGRTSQISELNDQIANWTQRLAVKQDQLNSQFTAMETALGRLKDQGNWLAGQIANLPTSSSTS
jgi:flagellar hook-associated protein 2